MFTIVPDRDRAPVFTNKDQLGCVGTADRSALTDAKTTQSTSMRLGEGRKITRKNEIGKSCLKGTISYSVEASYC